MKDVKTQWVRLENQCSRLWSTNEVWQLSSRTGAAAFILGGSETSLLCKCSYTSYRQLAGVSKSNH
jgi:hypothetical protein